MKNIVDETFRVIGTYLVKETIYEDGTKSYKAKQVLDLDMREELQFGWSDIKTPTREPVEDLETVKKMLM